MPKPRWLIAWFQYTLNGGLNRFAQVARVLRPQGYRIQFVSLTDERETAWPDFPGEVLTWDQARRGTYDAVMVPGAGASDELLARLAWLRQPNFGLRVQHVLNEPALLPRFRTAHRSFSPQVVVANNVAWGPADFAQLPAAAHHVLPGAVDSRRFAVGQRLPGPSGAEGRWRIGGYTGKNAWPLLEMLGHLRGGPAVELRLFGLKLPADPRLDAALAHAPVVQYGPLFGSRLVDFYRACDLVITTESCAGWCNVAAEAGAMGLPTIVTRHGTWSFAEHGRTAWVVDPAEPAALAGAVRSLTANPQRMAGLGQAAAARLSALDWQGYCRRLAELVDEGRHQLGLAPRPAPLAWYQKIWRRSA